jgi:hypothetical protein
LLLTTNDELAVQAVLVYTDEEYQKLPEAQKCQ